MTTEHINPRAQTVLKRLIEHFIASGTPVASKRLSEYPELALSAASIRNILADLEGKGFLASPHTSAGRVPTPKAYRFFVNRLLTVSPLEEAIVEQFAEQLTPQKDKNSLLQTSSQLLSGMTGLVAVVTLPNTQKQLLRHIEFLPLPNKRILVILVLGEKDVQNRIIEMDRDYTSSELEKIANFLNQHCAGKDMAQVRDNLLAQLQREKEHLDTLLRDAFAVAQAAFSQIPQADYVITGQENLLDVASERGVEALKSLFSAFTEKQEVMTLLNKCMHAQGVQIFIGEESGSEVFNSFSVVTAPYCVDGDSVGVIGVIGPQRLAYQTVIPVVDITAKILSSAL